MTPFDGFEPPESDASATIAKKDLSSSALEVVCQMLESPKMQDLWALHHHSRAEENVPAAIAAEIRENMHRMDTRPDLEAFVAEFVLAGLRAADSPEVAGLREDMAMMRESLPQPEGTGTYKARKRLREEDGDYKAVLDMIDVQMRQKPFLHSAGDFGAEYRHHITEAAKKKPKTFAFWLAASTGAMAFMKTNLKPAQAYIDPHAGVTMMDENGNEIVTTISSALTDMKFGCHSHIPLVSPETAESIGNALGGFGIHCSTIKNLDIKAQNVLQDGYDFIKTPFDAVMGWFVKNPLAEFGTQALQDSRYAMAYNETARIVSDWVYMGNTIENFTLHPLIFAFAACEGCRRSAAYGGTEVRETMTEIKDFIHRTVHDRPLNYVLPIITSAATWAYQGEFGTPVVLAGAAAGIAGHAVHKLKDMWDRKDHLRTIAGNAKDILHDFRQAAHEKGISAAFAEPVRKQWLSTKEKIAYGTASLSAYAAIVFAEVSGYAQTIDNDMVREAVLGSSNVLGAVTATGLIAGVFLPYNVLEDIAQHIVYGVAGYAGGHMLGKAQNVIGNEPG
jgi:hypothetical protein